jgi:outer membrane protein
MKKVIGILLGILFGQIAGAQVMSFTLEEAQSYAIENAYSVQNNVLEYEKSKKILLENISRGLPQVFASANWNNNLNLQAFVVDMGDGPSALTIGTPYTGAGTISGEQLIFDGSYIIAVLGSQVLKENSLNEVEKSSIDVREQVANAYHLVLVNQRTLKIVKDNLAFITKNYNESKKMFEVGFMEETDVDQLELIKSNLENQIDFLDKQNNIAMMLLKFNMGMDVTQTIELTDDIETLMTFSQDGASLLNTQFELEENIDYRILTTQERGQTLNLKNENMAYLPKLKLNYLYQHNVFGTNPGLFVGTENVDYVNNIQQNFGLNLSVPILTGGSRMARVAQAKINLDQIDIYKKQLRDNLKLQYETAKAEYSYALNSYYTQQRNVEISKKIRDTNSKKFSEGIIGSLEFTQAENQYQDALRSIIEAANNVLDKKVKLEKIIGKYNN